MKLSHAIGAIAIAAATALALAGTPADAGGKKSGWCPPGLAKKGSCVPPGLQGRGGSDDGYREGYRDGRDRYRDDHDGYREGYEAGYRDAVRQQWRSGEYIPPDVVYQRVYYRDYNLPRPQSGYSYVTVGGDLYLMAEATRKVIEAINLVDRIAQ